MRRLARLTMFLFMFALPLLACADYTDGSTNSAPTMAATPRPTPTPNQHATDLAHDVVYYADTVDAEFVGGAGAGNLTVNVRLDSSWQWNHAVGTTAMVFGLMRKMWQSGMHLTEVSLLIYGPTTDSYGNVTEVVSVTAILTGATAKKFNWSNLTPDMAWIDYDHAWKRSGI